MGKQSKPTPEELKFVYGLIGGGYSDRDILEEYCRLSENSELKYPFRTDERFVKDRRKEFEAAREVLTPQIEKKLKERPEAPATYDPLTVDARRKHNEALCSLMVRWFEQFDVSIPVMLSLPSEKRLNDFHPDSEHCELSGTFLFECLKEHLQEDDVWRDCEEWEKLASDYEAIRTEIKKGVQVDTEEAVETIIKNSPEMRMLSLATDECLNDVRHRWVEFVNSLRGVGDSGSLDAFFRSACVPVAVEGNTLVLSFYHQFHKDKIEDPKYTRMVETKLAQKFGSLNKIRCVLSSRGKEPHISTEGIVYSVLQELAAEHQDAQVEEGADWTRLAYGDRQVANAPGAVVEAIIEVRVSLVAKWMPSAKRLRATASQLAQTRKRLIRRAEMLRSKGFIQGKCQVCRDL